MSNRTSEQRYRYQCKNLGWHMYWRGFYGRAAAPRVKKWPDDYDLT